jgi:hypothetical protein
MKPLIAFLVAATALTACAPPTTGGFTVPVTQDFSSATLRLTGGVAPAFDARWKVITRGGRAYLCGAGVREDGLLGSAVAPALRASTLEINGALVLSDMRFFNTLPLGTDLLQSTANCTDAGPAPAGSFNAHLAMGGRR